MEFPVAEKRKIWLHDVLNLEGGVAERASWFQEAVLDPALKAIKTEDVAAAKDGFIRIRLPANIALSFTIVFHFRNDQWLKAY